MKSVFLLIAFVASAFAADVKVVEEIIAKVNGEIITRSEIEHTRQLLAMELKQRGLSGERLQQTMQEHEKDALRDQIDQLLLVQKGKELSINVDTDVSKRLAQIQLDNKIADPDKFQQWIREQAGMSFEDFKQQMKNSILVQRVLDQEVGSRIAISKAEIAKYYEEHKKDFVRQEQVFLREIFLSTEGKTPQQVAAIEKKAKDLVARARKGEKFAELARDNSDAESAKNYGELPPFKRGDLKNDIEEIVFKQKKGYVTDPIRQPNGLLILKVEEHWEAGQASMEEVMPEIQQRLFEPRFQPQIRAYLTKLRQDAFLEIRDGYVDSGAAPGKDTRWMDPAQLKPETVTKEQVESRTRKKRLLWLIPIPGTSTTSKGRTKN
jgi:peptidyl-prolyl cis-trans isomerase SurA